jgi:hypothetical protein
VIDYHALVSQAIVESDQEVRLTLRSIRMEIGEMKLEFACTKSAFIIRGKKQTSFSLYVRKPRFRSFTRIPGVRGNLQ